MNILSQKIVDFVVSGSFQKTFTQKEKDKNYLDKREDYLIIREIEGVLTNYVVNKFFTHEDTLYSFLSLICKYFEEVLTIYCKKRNIKQQDLFFIYKGGNVLRIVSKEFWLDLPSSTSEELTEFYEKYFNRSDADFSIYLNPNIPNFDLLFKEISFISYLTLNAIRKEYLENTADYFDIYRYNKDYISKTLNKALSDVNKVEGANYKYLSLGNIKNDGTTIEPHSSHDKIIMGKSEEQLETILYNSNSSLFVNKMRELMFIDRNGNKAYFSLMRSKVKFSVWNDKGYAGKLWGELIDVTVIHKDYYNVQSFFSNVSNYITKYNITYSNDQQLSFKSYSLKYLIMDLEDILFFNEMYIWNDKKYRKRVKRLMYLYFVEIFIQETIKDKRIEIYQELNRYFENEVPASYFNDRNSSIYNVVDYIERINKDLPESEIAQFEEFKKEVRLNIYFIIKTLQNIKSYCSTNGNLDINKLYQTRDIILK